MQNANKLLPRYRQVSGTALLLLCFLALVFGVTGAVYLERPKGPAAPLVASVPPALSPAERLSAAPPPAAETQKEQQAERLASANAAPAEAQPGTAAPAESVTATPPEAPPQPTAEPAPIPEAAPPQSAATESLPPPDSDRAPPALAPPSLAQIAPSAAPAAVAAAAGRYWIEFGAYRGTTYAAKLQQRLKALGVETAVTRAPGRAHHTYLRVRSAGGLDRLAALATRDKAAAALAIKPLLHEAAATRSGHGEAPKLSAKASHYWVQFAASRSPAAARQTVRRLAQNHVAATVISRHVPGEAKPLYLIRATNLPNRVAAESVAKRGATALHRDDFLLGRALHQRGPPG